MATRHIAKSRRAVIIGIAAAPFALSAGAGATELPSGDETVLAAFQVRQSALAAIQARGTYYDCETHSPQLARIHDDAEMRVIRTPGTTPQAALAKAWCALAHCGDGFTERKQEVAALVHRCDFDALEPLAARELDFDEECIFEIIRTLRAVCGEA